MGYLKMEGESAHMVFFYNDVIKLPGKMVGFHWLAE